jgi:hypothetical protein
MDFGSLFDIYQLLSEGQENIALRKHFIGTRKWALNTFQDGFVKQAFDTRRIDQETEYNPRRGLQTYNRSEAFISEAMATKIENFTKLRDVLVGLKDVYGKEPEWQDSNARVLLSTLDAGLRTSTNDGDFTACQPGVGSFDYIEELMHMRYRLGFDDLSSMGETDLRKVILSKDEELLHKGLKKSLEITKSDVAKYGYDTLLDKLFNVQATQENSDVERTVTITIRDTIKKQGK